MPLNRGWYSIGTENCKKKNGSLAVRDHGYILCSSSRYKLRDDPCFSQFFIPHPSYCFCEQCVLCAHYARSGHLFSDKSSFKPITPAVESLRRLEPEDGDRWVGLEREDDEDIPPLDGTSGGPRGPIRAPDFLGHHPHPFVQKAWKAVQALVKL